MHCKILVCVHTQHGADTRTGQFAVPCKSARPRRHHDVCPRNFLGLEFAVELRLGKKSTGQLEDFIGTAQLLVLALQSFDTVTLFAGNAIAQPGVDFLFTDLFMQRLGDAADLGRN